MKESLLVQDADLGYCYNTELSDDKVVVEAELAAVHLVELLKYIFYKVGIDIALKNIVVNRAFRFLEDQKPEYVEEFNRMVG